MQLVLYLWGTCGVLVGCLFVTCRGIQIRLLFPLIGWINMQISIKYTKVPFVYTMYLFFQYFRFVLLVTCITLSFNSDVSIVSMSLLNWWYSSLTTFTEDGLPKTIDDYFTFIDGELDFLKKRNQRIKEYCDNNLA